MGHYPARFLVTVCIVLGTISSRAYSLEPQHALSLFGTPKYSAEFRHFDYVNPEAPKAGTLRQIGLRSFDTFNPFIIRGKPVSGLGLIYETLMTGSVDEVDTSAEYGLIAESVEVAVDYSWVAYNLRKNARWHDGRPITAEDVAFSMNTLREKGRPFYRAYYKNIQRIEIVSKSRIKFFFDNKMNRELPQIVGQLFILPKHYYQDVKFDATTLDPPLGSGPYRIDSFEAGKFIVYSRVRDYWGTNLPVNKGRYNFDQIRYDYYRDLTVAREAFKAGEFDFFSEHSAKEWATAYDFPAIKKEHVIKEEIPDLTSPGMQAFVFNTRRSIFSDRRAREAVGKAFDFEWLNKNIFYNQYKRTSSFFQNMELASDGIPRDLELKYLEPHRSSLPEPLFTEQYRLPVTDGSGNPRRQLREAVELLKEAGWSIQNDRLRNNKGEAFEFEITIVQPSLERMVLPFIKNLEKLGIEVHLRTIDSSQYMQRLDEYDFDMIITTFRQSFSPGNEQRNFWGSAAAEQHGGRNFAGIKHPAVDKLIEQIITAPDREHLVAATRALDRVLLWNHYVVPQYHTPNRRIAYWNRFGQPRIRPKFGIDIMTWWHDTTRSRKLEQATRK